MFFFGHSAMFYKMKMKTIHVYMSESFGFYREPKLQYCAQLDHINQKAMWKMNKVAFLALPANTVDLWV